MRSQLNELIKFTEKLQDEIIRLNLPTSDKLDVSKNIKVYTASKNEFVQVTFNGFPNKVDVTVHKINGDKYITANVSVPTVTDEDLDKIVMRSDVQITNFVKDLESTVEKFRLEAIERLQKELKELQENVPNS